MRGSESLNQIDTEAPSLLLEAIRRHEVATKTIAADHFAEENYGRVIDYILSIPEEQCRVLLLHDPNDPEEVDYVAAKVKRSLSDGLIHETDPFRIAVGVDSELYGCCDYRFVDLMKSLSDEFQEMILENDLWCRAAEGLEKSICASSRHLAKVVGNFPISGRNLERSQQLVR